MSANKISKHLILSALIMLLGTIGIVVQAASKPPSSPRNLSVSYNSSGHLVLDWEEPSDSGAQANWYDGAWPHRKKLTIDNSQVAGGTPLTNIPVLVSVIDADLSKAKPNGRDILFTDSIGAKLMHDIERFDQETGTMYYWVKIPELSASTDTEIYMYYGNASSGNQQKKALTWANSYGAIWHLNQNPASIGENGFKDITANNNHGTDHGEMSATNSLNGKIATAVGFDGVDDYIEVARANSLEPTTAITIETWFNWDDPTASTGGKIINKSKQDNSAPFNSYSIQQVNSNSQIEATINVDGVEYTTDPVNLSAGSWHHLVMTWSSGSPLNIYLDGSLAESTANISGSIEYYNTPLRMAHSSRGEANTFIEGKLDEVRVSSVARSASWIQTQYNNLNNAGAFWTVSAEEDYGGDISDYIVQYKPASSENYITFSDGISVSTQATIPGLVAGTEYNFRVAAVNDQGTSDFSNPLQLSIARNILASEIEQVLFLCEPVPMGSITTECRFTLREGLKLPEEFAMAIGEVEAGGNCESVQTEVICTAVPIEPDQQRSLKLFVQLSEGLIDSGENVNIYDPSEEMIEVYDQDTITEILDMITSSSTTCQDYPNQTEIRVECSIILKDTSVPGYDIKTGLVNEDQEYTDKCEFLGLQYMCAFTLRVDGITGFDFVLFNGAQQYDLGVDISVGNESEDQNINNPISDESVNDEQSTTSINPTQVSILVGLLGLSLICLFLLITLTYDGFWDKVVRIVWRR